MNRLRRSPALLALAALILLQGSASSGGGSTSKSGGVTPLPVVVVPSGLTGSPLVGKPGAGGLELPGLPSVSIPVAGRVDAPGSSRLNASSSDDSQNPGAPAAPQTPLAAGEQGAEAAQTPSASETAGETAAAPAAPAAQNGAQEQLSAAGETAAPLAGAEKNESSAESQAVDGQAAFDGAAKRRSARDVFAGFGRSLGQKFVASRLAGYIVPHGVVEKVAKASGVPAPPKKVDPNRDEWGGPKYESRTFLQKLGFGFKWGMNLLGVSTILQYTLYPLIGSVPWQLHVGSETLSEWGRVELLTSMGPAAIAQGMMADPLAFIFLQLPMASVWEEFMYRGLGFGLWFFGLAAIRPLARYLSGKLTNVPDLFSFRSSAQRLLGDGAGVTRPNGKVYQGVQRISSWAFPIAMVYSVMGFAAAHFPAWGANPYTYAVHFILGLGLTWVAYKTRSLFASATAHMVVNALPLIGIAAGIMMGSVIFAQIYTLALGLFSVGWLFYSWRKHRKDKRLLTGGGAAALILALTVGLGSLIGESNGRMPTSADASWLNRPAVVVPAQHAPKEPAPAPKQDTSLVAPQAPGVAGQAAGGQVIASATAADSALSPLLSRDEQIAAIIAKAKPAVAKVVVRTAMGEGSGSGFVVRKEGLLITNAHVTEAVGVGGIVTLEFADGTEVQGKVVAQNRDRDIAFVQLPEKKGGWDIVPIGDSGTLKEGHAVITLGHPLGLPFSAALGIVSGVEGNRGTAGFYVHQIQTDAAINHGNSGGPLVNMKGEVVAMNTAIAAPTPGSGNIGIGFSITSVFLTQALAQFDATGNINSSMLGIIIDMSDPLKPEAGLVVEQVRPGSAAAKGGLKPGDLITGVQDKVLGRNSVYAMAAILAKMKPGEPITLLILRDGEPLQLTFPLGSK